MIQKHLKMQYQMMLQFKRQRIKENLYTLKKLKKGKRKKDQKKKVIKKQINQKIKNKKMHKIMKKN